MTILYLESVPSTQTYLKHKLLQGELLAPVAIVANIQTDGIGSRDNLWIGLEGNLFFSFAIALEMLPEDLRLESSSIYFSYLLKETLNELGSQVWLKWPNDFYINEVKIGGAITHLAGENLVCGIGVNLFSAPKEFNILDITISKETLLNAFFKKIEKKILWKQVFSNYELEFAKSRKFFTHVKNMQISLSDVELQSDGSIIKNGERIYSLR